MDGGNGLIIKGGVFEPGDVQMMLQRLLDRFYPNHGNTVVDSGFV